MYGSPLPQVVDREVCVLFMLLVSLDCPFCIAPSVLSNVYSNSLFSFFKTASDIISNYIDLFLQCYNM